MRVSTAWAVSAALAILTKGGATLAQDRTYPDYPYHMMWGGGGWFMGPFMMLAFLGLAVVLVALLVRWLWPGHGAGNAGTNSRSAHTILEERYARGEIDREEFEEKRRTLGR